MDPEIKALLTQIVKALQDIEKALQNPAVDSDLQQIIKVLGQIAENGAP